MRPIFSEPIDVHQYEVKLHQQLDLLAASPMLPENKAAIREFADFCTVDPRVGTARIVRYFYALRVIGELVDTPFRQMNEAAIMRLLAALQEKKTVKGRPYSPASLHEFRKAISKFWRWLYFDEYRGDAPPPIRRMRTGRPRRTGEPDIYSRDEIYAIINGMVSARNKAFFACKYDLACRVGELLTRRLKHIRHTDEGDLQMRIDATKTGVAHWETLFESVPHVTTWLRLHPLPDEPEAPLWIMQKVDDVGERAFEPWTYPAARKAFLTACRRLGIRRGKHNRMHMFRKSKATHDLADGVPITYIESRGSWTKGSQALRDCYLSVIQRDKDNAYRAKYKLAARTDQQERQQLRRCRRCRALLEREARLCARCGTPVLMGAMGRSRHDVQQLDQQALAGLVRRVVREELHQTAVCIREARLPTDRVGLT